MEKEILVEFSKEANSDYKELQRSALEERNKGKENSSNIQLLKAINREIQNLRIDPQHGTHIPRKYIPKKLIDLFGTDRIWKIDLVRYWRLLYTIQGNDLRIICFVLGFMDHDDYNKLFGYRKK